jgi:SOS-response transcriptional repressor LexA
MAVRMIPLVSKHAHAGYLAGYADPEYLEDMPLVPMYSTKEHRGHYVAFEVTGDSMDDGSKQAILDGDVVICREVGRQHWVNKLHIHQYQFVIVHREQGITVKTISDHNTATGSLLLTPLNSFYDPYTVMLDDVAQLFNIVQVIRSR